LSELSKFSRFSRFGAEYDFGKLPFLTTSKPCPNQKVAVL
jgi:hypothetical protein